MDHSEFYGTDTPTTETYLEFGNRDLATGERQIYDTRLHQQAYDWFMLARYANDIATIVRLTRGLEAMDAPQAVAALKEGLHHPNTLTVHRWCLAALHAARTNGAAPSFFELGQTLFGCIEGMDLTQRLLARFGVDFPVIDPAAVAWRGADISELFNTLAAHFHPGLDVRAAHHADDLDGPHAVAFAKGVTLIYACPDLDALLRFTRRGRICVFDYSFSLDGDRISRIGTGKTTTHVGLDGFLAAMARDGRRLYVSEERGFHEPEKRLTWLNCLVAPQNEADAFMDMEAKARRGIAEAGLDGAFLSIRPGGLDWMTARDFAASLEK